MSTSYYAGVILGVKLSEIGYSAKLKTEMFEVHDKKGKSTGKFDYDYNWEITFGGKKTIEEGKRFYIDYVEDYIKVEKPIEILNLNYDFDYVDVDKFVIGVVISSGNDYDDGSCLKEIDINSHMEKVKAEFKKQFGLENVDLKIYFYFKIC